ncbi:phage tail tape measure protein [Serratia marcescens]
MKELAFLLSLKNNLSSPLGKAQQSVESFAKTSRTAFAKVGVGAAGLWGITQGVKGILGPAAEVRSALDDLESRGVGSKALDGLYKSAQHFSTAYGKSAAEFIASTSTIRSHVAGLTDAELPRYVRAINTLAVATKTSADDAAGYMAALGAQFSTTAQQMGNVPFAEMMASKTAYLQKQLGVDMASLKGALGDSSKMSTKRGIGMDEQLASLGLLNSQMGAGAGKAYSTLLQNAARGGRALGVSLTDARGQLLQFPDILQKLQAKFGDTIDGNVQAQKALNAAFGNGADALRAAWGQADKLRTHMRDMGNIHGLDRATEMAIRMADTWERLDQVWKRIRVAIGMALIPAIQPLIDYAIEAGAQFAKWFDMFPNIARWIGYITLSTLALAAAGAVANLVAGVSRFIWIGLTLIWKGTVLTLKALVWTLNIKARALQIARIATLVYGATLRVWRITLLAATLALKVSTAAIWLQRAGLMVATGAMRAFAIVTALAGGAMQILMSPITLIIAGIALLAAGIWYAVTHWDELKASLMDTQAFQWVMQAVTVVGAVFGAVWRLIKTGWAAVVDYFAGTSPVEAFLGFVDAIGNVFSGLWDWLMASFGKTYNWIVEKLNHIPGVNIDLKPVGDTAPGSAGALAPAGLSAPQVTRGGIGKALAGSQSKVTDNSRHVGTVNVYPQNGETFDALMESRELAAG